MSPIENQMWIKEAFNEKKKCKIVKLRAKRET